MAPTFLLVVTVSAMIFSRASCVPAIPQKVPSNPPILPAVLSGDQSLPVRMTLPANAMPADMMAGMNQPGVQAVPAVNSVVNPVLEQTPLEQGMSQAGPVSGQGQYPVHSLNNVATSRMAQMDQLPPQANSVQGFNAAFSTGQVSYQMGMSSSQIKSPMNMYGGQVTPSVSANAVLMNIQMACHSLQSFVLGSPIAREIMTSVANMNNMADLFRTSQCGFPALSSALRMFLKTCNMLTSCPNPAYVPFPVFTPSMSPAVPYMVQPPKTKPTGAPVKVKVQKPLTKPSAANVAPQVHPNFQATVTPAERMFQTLMYGFRPNNINNLAGLRKQANATQEPSGAGDD